MNQSNESSTAKIIGAALIALVVGIAGGFAAGHNAGTTTNTASAPAPSSATKASDVRSSLVRLGTEHMLLTDQAVDAALDGTPNAQAAGAALYANGNDIGAVVGSVYGDSAQSTFDSVWKLHLDQFVKYAVASKGNDAAGKQAALTAIQTGYTKPLSQYLAKANPNLSEATLESSLGDHVGMTARMIDDHVAGKYSDETTELKMASQHLEGLFSSLADAIVKQFPAKF